MMVAPDTLERLPFFDSLETAERELLAPLAHQRHCRAGEEIFAEGQAPDSVRILVRGLVSFRQRLRHGGEQITLGTAGEAGDIFGLAALVGQANLYPHSAVCLEDTELIEIDGARLLALCEAEPTAGVHILRLLSRVMARHLSAAREQIRSRIRPGLISHG